MLVNSRNMQNPFIPNTISYRLFKLMQTGQRYTIPKLQGIFEARADLITYILRRDNWLYQHDAATASSKKQTASTTKDRKKVAADQIGLLKNGNGRTKQKGSTFTKKTQFWLRDASDISQEKLEKQIANTKLWLKHKQ